MQCVNAKQAAKGLHAEMEAGGMAQGIIPSETVQDMAFTASFHKALAAELDVQEGCWDREDAIS